MKNDKSFMMGMGTQKSEVEKSGFLRERAVRAFLLDWGMVLKDSVYYE